MTAAVAPQTRIIATVLLAAMASTAYAQAIPSPCAPQAPIAIVEGDWESATPDADLAPFSPALPASPAVAWDIVLEIQDPRSLDLELEVYDRDPRSTMPGDPVCVSNQPGSIKRCRVNADRLRGAVWARATPVGTGKTAYRFSIRALMGPVIGETGLFGGDARPSSGTTIVGSFEPSLYSRADAATSQQLFCVAFPSKSMTIQLSPTKGAGLFTVSAYGRTAGNQVRLLSEMATAMSDAFLFVPVPGDVADGFVLVRLEGRSNDAVGYKVEFQERADWRGTVAGGYVYRTLLTEADYTDLSVFGRCHEPGSTPDPQACASLKPAKDIYQTLQRYAWGIALPKATITDPMIVFFGVDRLSTTLLVEPTEEKTFADPQQTVLRARGALWTVYIEDDDVQFETSANVRFSQGDQLQDYILERAGSRERLRASASGRMVRIGVKRFQSERAPVNVLVTFSRQGQNYPRQDWSRTYRLRDRSKLSVTFGLTVVANDVRANYHQVVLVGREFQSPGADAEIVQFHRQRYLFGSVLFSWPSMRAKCSEEKGTAFLPCASWRAFVPNFSVGLGVPMQGPDTYLLAANWPISGMDLLQFTLGVTATRQQKLSPNIRMDRLISRDADIAAYTYQKFVYVPLLGLTVDVGAIAGRFR